MMRYRRECNRCEATENLMYVYPVAGLRSNEGLLLCSTCRKDLSIEPFGLIGSGRRKGNTKRTKRTGSRSREGTPVILEPNGDAEGGTQ